MLWIYIQTLSPLDSIADGATISRYLLLYADKTVINPCGLLSSCHCRSCHVCWLFSRRILWYASDCYKFQVVFNRTIYVVNFAHINCVVCDVRRKLFWHNKCLYWKSGIPYGFPCTHNQQRRSLCDNTN